MLDVVCWLWQPPARYRSQYGPKHVNVLRRMVARHYRQPHRFSVITDQPESDFEPDVRVIPIWDDFADLPSSYGPRMPSCYRRLKAFSPEMASVIGPRFVSVDLDCVIVGDVSPLWDRPEDFVVWAATHRRTPYNASMWLTNAGARPQVWEGFRRSPADAIHAARKAGYYGSDQGWLNHVLDRREAFWSEPDGVYSYRMHLRAKRGELPANARIVMFEGSEDPDHVRVQSTAPWVREHYR